MRLLILHKVHNDELVGVNPDQVVSVVEEIHEDEHQATEVYTTNPYIHHRVTERLMEIDQLLTPMPETPHG